MEGQKKDPPSVRHRCARVEMFSNHSQDRGSRMQVTTYGVDLAKRVFQVHWVEPDTGEVKRKMIMRGELRAFFARAVVNHSSGPGRTPSPWLRDLLSRRPKNVVIVALANKIARTIWALLAHGRTFDRRWGQVAPAPVF